MKNTGLLLLLIFLMCGCNSFGGQPGEIDFAPPETRPDDFALRLDWATGTMAEPQLQYGYRVIIIETKAGELIYFNSRSNPAYTTTFTVTSESLDDLYSILLKREAMRNNWAEGDPIDGGPEVTVEFTAAEKSYRIPYFSELTEQERQRAWQIFEDILALVPEKDWNEMMLRQKQAELNTDSN